MFVIPGTPALAPNKVESVKTFGGCDNKGSIGNKFVAKYILLIGQSIGKGLNSVVVDRKLILVPPTSAVD